MTLRQAGRDDLTAVVAVMQAVDVATLGEADTTEEDVASGWDESDFDLTADAFVVEDGRGAVVGYAELYDRGEGGIFDTDVYPHPRSETAVGEALLDAVLERAAVRAGSGAKLATWLGEDDFRGALFASRGFTPARRFVRMRHEHAPPALQHDPPDILLRRFDPPRDAAAVHQVLVAAFAHHARPMTPSLERFTEQHLCHPDFNPEYWIVAELEGRIAGAITGFNHGDVGFIRHVGVLAEHRGKGIATALLLRVLRLLADDGQRRVDLGVDVDDEVGAMRLYERLGFDVLQRLELVERRL